MPTKKKSNGLKRRVKSGSGLLGKAARSLTGRRARLEAAERRSRGNGNRRRSY